MANGDDPKKLFPIHVESNPSSIAERGQDFKNAVQAQTDLIMEEFLANLPSNYVSQVTGPFYSIQFQAAAEQLAVIQITAQEIFEDSDFDFTRPEFLWEILGTMVFPRGGSTGIPNIDGDLSYRDFLKDMVKLLLRGATPFVVKEGVELLTDADIEVLEKFLFSRDPNSAWGFDDQFSMEINVSVNDGTEFPDNPFILQDNVVLVLDALKPAHTLYDYRHLFKEFFGDILQAEVSMDIETYYYDDTRKLCFGAKSITGDVGETLSDRTCFRDTTKDFTSVPVGAFLTIETGNNAGKYCVVSKHTWLSGDDSIARAYTTSPTGLSGSLTVSGDDATDPDQNWALAVENETLTITEGPNAGTYRLNTVLGSNGGPVGFVVGPSTKVRVSQSILKIERRMPQSGTGQSYNVTVDRLGVRIPQTITGEDVSSFFFL